MNYDDENIQLETYYIDIIHLFQEETYMWKFTCKLKDEQIITVCYKEVP